MTRSSDFSSARRLVASPRSGADHSQVWPGFAPAPRRSMAHGAAACLALATVFLTANAHGSQKEDALNHDSQVGLRLGFTLPYKVNFQFDDSPPCGTRDPMDDEKVCPIAAPPALDLALSYALSGTVEPFFWARFGLAAETKTSTQASTLIGAGLRLYTQNDSRFKVYLQPAIAAELSGATVVLQGRNWETDFVMQVHLGGQYDFSRYVGAYVSLGPSVAIVRALSLGVEGSIGVQARYP
jgi:hypothetical protein